jgi:hypothetical protein
MSANKSAMLGAGIGEVAPDLAPAARPVGILDPDEHSNPFGHGAERGENRFLDGRAEDMGFDTGERRTHSAACWLNRS